LKRGAFGRRQPIHACHNALGQNRTQASLAAVRFDGATSFTQATRCLLLICVDPAALFKAMREYRDE
jgi:hypothetical protein